MPIGGDFLVIGSGIAGLRAAISLAEAGRVVILTKANPQESNTGYAQGGIAAAVGADDSPELHASDTMAAGDGLCAPEAVRALTEEGPRYVRELLDWGAAFDRAADGQPALGREAAHTVRRVLHAHDATGREIARVLGKKVSAHPNVTICDDALVMELVTTASGECAGAAFVERDGKTLQRVEAQRTLIATGGAGQVYRETTNPPIATGDGIAMAFEAGARVADLEFVQFHPTVLSAGDAPRFLLSEALRGEGARLINDAGEPFMTRYEPAGDLASRDLVARAIVKEVARTGAPVYLTMAHLDGAYIRKRFPTIVEVCRAAGFDLTTDRVPVSPAAHYMMGGVETDLHGRTSVPRLFAAGEVACTGVHGANRLASNSLLEGLVFGARAAVAMQGAVVTAALTGSPGDPIDDYAGPGDDPTPAGIRELMWRHVGLVRTADGLRTAVSHLREWRATGRRGLSSAPDDRERRRLASLATVGFLIARAALRREETRGGHFRADFPDRDDIHFKKHFADVRRL
ncbi:MAG TPA: L-aspartate oxidase [Vicinamibacterales bacterium]|nr:L-aspartate oxidase [Vicinamibacterales bacterium]